MRKELIDLKKAWYKLAAYYVNAAEAFDMNPFEFKVYHIIFLLKDDCTQKKLLEYTSGVKQAVNNVVKKFEKDANSTEFENITNAIPVEGVRVVGGICGFGSTIVARNCSNSASVTNITGSFETGDCYDIAGICGYAETDSEFIGCSN